MRGRSARGATVAAHGSGLANCRLAADAAVDTLEHGFVLDADIAASQFNWLVMSGPLNEAMLLGDAAIPSAVELSEHARRGVRVFLAAHGVRP